MINVEENGREGGEVIRSKKARINQQIRVPQVRLIDENGVQVGVVATSDALKRSEAVGLDLVEIAPNSEPPVCRIMDYGKYLFNQSQRKKAQKKKQKLIQVKEVKFRPSTDVGDFQVKMRKICTFLERGNKVKVSLRFRGREMQHKQLGYDLLKKVIAQLPEGSQVEQDPRIEGRQMTMIVIMSIAK